MDPSNQDILLEYRKNNFAPIPQLSLDSIILLFLKKYDVDVTPPQSLGVDLSDRLLFAVAGPVAMLNTGIKNQIRSSEKSEWISWKQWALLHPEFNEFKCDAISKVDIYNRRLQEYLQSDEGIKVISSIEKDRHDKEKEENIEREREARKARMRLLVVFLALTVFPMMVILRTFDYNTNNLNKDENQSEIPKPN
jgi:hypothetical protein